MERVIDYQIVSGEDFQIIADSIKELLKSGWQPIGGIAIDAAYQYHQAMVLYEYVNID
jgi:Domain of unknown function (DUF1737)